RRRLWSTDLKRNRREKRPRSGDRERVCLAGTTRRERFGFFRFGRADGGTRWASKKIFPRYRERVAGSSPDAIGAEEIVAGSSAIGRRNGMKSSHPPIVATWLFEHLVSGREKE